MTAPPRRVLAATCALAVFLVVLSTRPPVGSEVRYVLSAREMVEGGDWVVPHLCHVPYLEKPILLYWAAAAARRLLGGSDVALRVPSILAGLATFDVTYGLAVRLRGVRFALAAAGMLATSVLFALLSSVLMTDALFAAFLVAAWFALWRHREEPDGPWIWGFWAAVGLAVLTKGLLALGFVGVSVAAYLTFSRRLRDVATMRPLAGPALVLLLQVPWTLLVLLRDPRLVEFYYVRQNLGAFVSSDVNHDRSPLYYVPGLVAGAFPWSALLVAVLPGAVWRIGGDAVRRFRARDPAPAGSPDDLRLYLVSIAVPSFLLLSVAGSKLATYLLPILPAFVVLLADRVASLLESRDLRFRHAFLVQGVLLAAGAAAAPAIVARVRPEKLLGFDPAFTPLVVAALALLALGSLAAWFALPRPAGGRSLVPVGATAAAVVATAALAGPSLAPDADGSGMAARMESLRRPGDRVVVASRISQDLTVFLPLRERVSILGTPGELGMGHFVECTPPSDPIPEEPTRVRRSTLPSNPWLLEVEDLLAAWDGPGRVWFVARPGEDLDPLVEAGRPVHVLAADGQRTIVTNRPLEAER